MAENDSSSSCEGFCDKILRAICCISDNPQYPQSSKPTSPPPTSLPGQKMTTTPEPFSAEIPVTFNTPANPVIVQGHNQAARVAPKPNNEKVSHEKEAAKPAPAKAVRGKEGSRDDDFSNYVDRTNVTIRTTSSVGVVGGGGGGGGGGGKSVARLDTFHDKVTNYLNRARLKIRTTSNVGGRRGVSIE